MSEQFLYFLQQMFNGVTLGSTYALIAIGYTMVYGIIGMINFAHGEVYMIGSYGSFMIIAALMMLGIDTGWLLVVAGFVGAIVIASAYGWSIERVAYRPVRNRDPKLLAEYGKAACEDSGYQEMTLSSLSTSDYRRLLDLCDGLQEWCDPNGVSLSLPSLRADNFSLGLMERVQHVRKSGLTFAPEAGTQRLRDAINKNVTEEEILRSCRTAFSGGWSSVKLYFMLGLPTETDEDVLGIAELAEKVYKAWKECTPNPKRGVTITVSTACFVPKPHTAFQWEAQVSMEEYRRRVKLLRDNMRGRSIRYNWHDPATSFLEAVFSRGDRRGADVIEEAGRQGAKFDAWSEYFDFDRWMAAFDACGLDPAFYANRVREKDEVLPWSVTSTGVTTPFLWRERERAYQAVITPDCRVQCTGCGADKLYPGGKCDAEA